MDHWFCDEPFVCGHLKPSAFVPAKGSASKKRPLPLASCCSVTGLNPRLVFDAPMATAVTFPDKKEMMALADKKPVDDRERKPGKAKHSHRIHVPYKSKLEASSSSGLRVIVRSSSPSASPLYESRAPKTFSGSFRFTACPVSHSKRRATQKTKQKGGWPFLPIFAHGLDLRMPVDPVPTTLQSEPAVETRPVSPFEPAAFDKQPGAEECLVDPDSLLSGGSALVASPPCAVLFSYSMPGLRRVDILQTLACALDSIVSTRNDVLPKPATLFHSVSVPLVSAGTYLKHLASKLCFSVQACVIGFAFLDMFAQHQTTSPFVEVDQLTVHRLLLTWYVCQSSVLGLVFLTFFFQQSDVLSQDG